MARPSLIPTVVRSSSLFVDRFQRLIVQTIALFSFLVITDFTLADHMPKPEGEVLLTITGNIKTTNTEIEVDGKKIPAATFDIDMLEALPSETIKTGNPWTTGVTEFKGVRFDVLLDSVGADHSRVSLHALDEYSVDIVDGEFADYPIVLAYLRDGHYMNVRNLGPLWLMYPFDDFPFLDTSQNRGHCVWQLIRIEVK